LYRLYLKRTEHIGEIHPASADRPAPDRRHKVWSTSMVATAVAPTTPLAPATSVTAQPHDAPHVLADLYTASRAYTAAFEHVHDQEGQLHYARQAAQDHPGFDGWVLAAADKLHATLASLRTAFDGLTAASRQAAWQSDAADANQPEVVCLCGSTRFVDEFLRQNLRLTREGKIVLSIGCDTRSDAELGSARDLGGEAPATKRRLAGLHMRKIDLADQVLILNVGGYIGESTRAEVEYAAAQGKTIDYLEAPT